MRLINKGFENEPRYLNFEVPESLYRIDIVLDLPERREFKLAVEVTDPITK
jgi:hypothetical protein